MRKKCKQGAHVADGNRGFQTVEANHGQGIARTKITSNACSGTWMKPSSGRCGTMTCLPHPTLQPQNVV